MEKDNSEEQKYIVQKPYKNLNCISCIIAIVMILANIYGLIVNLTEGNYRNLFIFAVSGILTVMFFLIVSYFIKSKNMQYSMRETSTVTSLADNYDMVFYIDTVSKSIIQYSCNAPFTEYFNPQNKKIAPDKFDEVMNRLIYSEDYDNFRKNTSFNLVMLQLKKDGAYNTDFRLLLFGKPVWYRIRFVLDMSCEGVFLAGIRNINDEKVGSVQLRKQESVFRHCLDLLGNEENIQDSINKVLEIIARFYESDRAYIFEFDRDCKTMNNTYEYCRNGATSEMKNLQNLDIHIIDSWMTPFEEEGTYFFSSLERQVDKNSLVYKILEPQGIDSLIVAPIRTDGRIVGFLGVDNPGCDTEEKFLIRAISSVLYIETSNMKHLERKQKVVDAVLSDYLGVFYVDMKNDDLDSYKVDASLKDYFSSASSYFLSMKRFVESCTDLHERSKILEMITPDYIGKKLSDKALFSVPFTYINGDGKKSVELTFLKVKDNGACFVLTINDRTKEIDRENIWSQKDIEYKVQLTRLKRKEIILKQALIKCSSGYMDVNLTKNRIIGNVLTKGIGNVQKPWIITDFELDYEFSFDDFEKWWAKKYILSDKEQYCKILNSDNLLDCFNRGQMSVEFNTDTYIDGTRLNGDVYVYMSREIETGDVMALIIVKNHEKIK